jgi:hypothetical protein
LNTHSKTTARPDAKMILSTVWIFLAVNYIFCDVLTGMEAAAAQGYLAGRIGGIAITEGFLLAAAIQMEIPFAMIVLSRILNGRANRWANVIAGIVLVVVQVGTMGMGTPPTLHYLFSSVVEIAGNLFIVWYAWKRMRPEV